MRVTEGMSMTKTTTKNTQVPTAKPIRPTAVVTAEIETLRNDLRTVNAAIPVIGGPAITKAEEIVAAIAAANEELAVALANEAEAARAQRLADFGDISVSASYAPGYEGNLLRAVFTITYDRLTYDQRARASLMQSHTIVGFRALNAEAMEYLQEVRPDAIPADIMDLAPGNPREAFGRYFMGLRKGSVSRAVAA